MGLYKNIALFLSFERAYTDNTNLNVIGKIISLPEESDNTNKYILRIIKNNKNFKIENKKFIIYTKKENEYVPGDIVNLNGTIKKAEGQRNLYGFDYKRYLKSQKIYGIIEVEDVKFLKTEKDFEYLLGKAKEKILKVSSKIYSEKYKNFTNKMLFNTKEKIDEKIQEDFNDAGLSHILAISGSHISYIIIFLNVIFKKMIKNAKLKNIVICIFLVFFVIFTGASASCMRACIMSVLAVLSKNNYRKSNVYINIFISFCMLLFINIYFLFDIGMWLSFLGTLGILVFYDFLKLFILYKKNKIIYQVQSIILISVSAQILIWPIILYVFNTVSFTFFISNLLISNLIGTITLLGYSSILISFLFFPLGNLLAKIEEFLLFILYKIAEICGNLPFSKVYITGNNFIFIIFYYISIVVWLVYFRKNKIKILRKIVYIKNRTKHFLLNKSEFKFSKVIQKLKNKKIEKCKKRYIEILKNNYIDNNILKTRKIVNQNFYREKTYKIIKKYITILIISVIISISVINTFLKDDFQLYFVDVGQGDCTIIKTLNKTIIIDGGEGNSDSYDYGRNVLLQHLLKLGIKKIDYMIFSHFDSDHAGGLIYILENLEIKNIVLGIQSESSKCLEDAIRIANKKNIEIIILEAGNRLEINKKCYIDVLWPKKDELISDNALNNNSLVFKLIYEDISILFTGDIEEVAEKKIVEYYGEKLKSTILKVGHHGSKTSTIPQFLECVSPKISLIGVGKNNNFGHPNSYVLDRLEKCGTKIYRTDINGEIIIKGRKSKISIKMIYKD